jgi:8-oxo-dGTP pyrophosphatase MutT (NUDIX family)
MQLVFATEPAPTTFTKSLFLAGPSPRDPRHPNWRLHAVTQLAKAGYDGVVFIPLPRDGQWSHSYADQVDWETRYLNMADRIVFWCPRDLTVCEGVAKGESAELAMNLPAFTTNMEFGLWVNSGKAILGYPEGAPKLRYLEHHALMESVPTAHSLAETLALAVESLGEGAGRNEGEREVPLHIWKLPHFQGWYKSQVAAGNRLDGARLLWSFRVGPTKGFTFAYTLHVDIYIASEGRSKVNEFIFGRPDIACIVGYQAPNHQHPKGGAYYTVDGLHDTEIALIREFRSPARTSDGFIREIPGGSSWKPGEDPFITMTHELEEETGLGAQSGFEIDPKRLFRVGTRQLAGTLSVHQAHVYACELTDVEMAYLKEQERTNSVHGVEADSERTYVEVARLGDLIADDTNTLDWSMLGMILTALIQ